MMEVIEMKGDMVIVRAFRGVPLVRRVWEEDENGIYITDEVHFNRLMAGEDTVQPIGFPREDVFKYDPEITVETDNLDWDRLTPF